VQSFCVVVLVVRIFSVFILFHNLRLQELVLSLRGNETGTGRVLDLYINRSKVLMERCSYSVQLVALSQFKDYLLHEMALRLLVRLHHVKPISQVDHLVLNYSDCLLLLRLLMQIKLPQLFTVSGEVP